MSFKCGLIVLVCGLVVCQETPQYKGFKVYEVIPTDGKQVEILHKLSESDANLDFWKLVRFSNEPAHVMVDPDKQQKFEKILNENGLKFSVINSDLSESIQLSESTPFKSTSFSNITDFNRYPRYAEVNAYLDFLAAKFPKTVKVNNVGKSFEGRPINTITISNGDERPDKDVIFIEAGIHAREWIAPASALYIIHQLVERSRRYTLLLKHFNWIILPVANPDGYEFTHTHDRFWRKTRRPNKECNGTDGNRNFDHKWGTVGASRDECVLTYQGPHPFSEPETQVIRNILHSMTGRGKMYISLHSYGRFLLYPWGWTSKLPKNWAYLDEIARAGANAVLRKLGYRYTVGSFNNVFYAASGISLDYAFANAKIPVAINMELPAGGSGFDPPPREILVLVFEAWEAVMAMANKVLSMNITLSADVDV